MIAKFTFTGQKAHDVHFTDKEFDESSIYENIKNSLNIPGEDRFDIYDQNDQLVKEISHIVSEENNINIIYKICIYNKNESNFGENVNLPDFASECVDKVSSGKYAGIYYKCRKTYDECQKLFEHYDTHYKAKPFIGNYYGGGKSFLYQNQLKTHYAVHQNSRAFSGTFPGCEKCYSKLCRLKVHLRSHSGVKPFICNYKGCGKRFSEKGNLKTHMRTHTGEKPYSCTYIGGNKRFSTQGHLIDHIRSHSDTKPFPCALGDKAFMRSSTLKVHLRDHTGDRPFRCNKCNKNFKEARALRSHLKIHDKEYEKIQPEMNPNKKISSSDVSYINLAMSNNAQASTMISDNLSPCHATKNGLKSYPQIVFDRAVEDYSHEAQTLDNEIFGNFMDIFPKSKLLDTNMISNLLLPSIANLNLPNYGSRFSISNLNICCGDADLNQSKQSALNHLSYQLMNNMT